MKNFEEILKSLSASFESLNNDLEDLAIEVKKNVKHIEDLEMEISELKGKIDRDLKEALDFKWKLPSALEEMMERPDGELRQILEALVWRLKIERGGGNIDHLLRNLAGMSFK